MGTTRRQADARREQRTLATTLRDWRDGRREAADKRREKAQEQAAKQAKKDRKNRARGVYRVPERLLVDHPAPEVVVQHADQPYRVRRPWAQARGMKTPPGTNVPHVNPDKDRRLAGKARRNMRRSSLMVIVPDGGTGSHVMPAAEYLAGRR